ncbi:MAG: hypothetical protein A3C08_01760 [Candidatus Taylorbacteria bacterium RIFCSPHIGHO2_02_FULL_47_18]|uniref:Uncharacterized protein n=1 Tax=Candidatus Taylorbacteria bacterium RIFCSPLOWO2_01_FULL_48_100 TaxID=1802322 RepID=A0A1G2NFK8_9BACT|nr:MAG: hypothetical protein A3C08_01760 [Candidatus Taylorbacteria bacterium RIFCSPHIGHO2_02_FULL_47_18]OHA34875.1 MAG: hypothetical protein A2938_00505 [Candidatus Taylorbacteria bacterium RIFCSPLOWO2_01_FULL_48_100]OHA40228.1 MAG: hypothetical protein A3J31_01465 [Candidatus Taylorbacteria bacterium RIFCSPLOWO2_02_FULL_48_16]OHA45438.1 MAG: hypothetical protein A3H13_01380 [Candidatus Taylorbacteria bacterium RIFCSPLOWO2_12_FULL_48_11]
MNMRNAKLLIGLLVLFAYVSMGVFGLFESDHTAALPMDNCPYSSNGFSVCANGLDHINKWQQFSNTPPTKLFTFLLFAVGIVLYVLGRNNHTNRKPIFDAWRFYIKKEQSNIYLDKITHWLSLFENSPSFYRKA